MPTINNENNKNIREGFIINVDVINTAESQTLHFDNNNIIDVQLELRADLSQIDPALPESEITVRAYCPEDISALVKTIDNDEPVYYTAGYEGDMSPVRKFYISEPVVWADKIVTVKAVDAVHFLEGDMPKCFIGAVDWTGNPHYKLTFAYRSTAEATRYLCATFYDAIIGGGVTLESRDETNPLIGGARVDGTQACSYIDGSTSRRDVIANLMNLVRIDFDGDPLDSRGLENALYLTYVDAGIPTFYRKKPQSKWTIYEKDCGDIKKNTARDIVKINAKNQVITDIDFYRENTLWKKYQPAMKLGSINITKNVGGAINLDSNAVLCDAVIPADYIDHADGMNVVGLGSIQANATILVMYPYTSASVQANTYGCLLYSGSSYMPWDSKMQTFWDNAVTKGVVSSDQNDASFDLYGGHIVVSNSDDVYTKSGSGVAESPNKTKWTGRMYVKSYNENTLYKILPDMGFMQLLNRSNITGSFTWKGDPRMQPRDVFTFVYRDGTKELRTIETISLKHEKGGTVATITYRKGIV